MKRLDEDEKGCLILEKKPDADDYVKLSIRNIDVDTGVKSSSVDAVWVRSVLQTPVLLLTRPPLAVDAVGFHGEVFWTTTAGVVAEV